MANRSVRYGQFQSKRRMNLISQLNFNEEQDLLEIPSFSDFRQLNVPPSEISIHDKKDEPDYAGGDNDDSKKKEIEGTLESIVEGIDTMPDSAYIHTYLIDKPWYKSFRSWFLVSDRTKIHRAAYRSSVSIFNERARHLATFPYVIHPYSDFRWIWDILLTLFLFGTLIIEPLRMTFYSDDLRNNKIQIQLSFLATTVFLIDIILSFFTGIVDTRNDTVSLDPVLISRKYLSTWFIIDFLSTIPFDLIYIYYEEGKAEEDMRQEDWTFKTCARLLELSKLLRLPRMIRVLVRIEVAQEIHGIYIRFINIILITIFLTHWLTCLQYLIPDLTREGSTRNENALKNSWVTQKGLWNATVGTKYLNSLLRSVIIQFCVGLGTQEIVENEELILTICSVLIGVVCYAFFTGLLASILLTEGVPERKYVEIIKQVKQYLKFKQIPISLQNRILQFYEHRFHKNFFNEEHILNSLSEVLRRDVLMYNCRQLIENVPLFEGLPQFVIYALVAKLHYEMYLPLDLIIKKDTVGESMYFIEHGMVTILQENGSIIGQLKDGDFFGEVSLISSERREANIVATSKCDTIQLQDLIKPRGGRISTWPWSSLIGRARFNDEQHLTTCYTTIGEVGKCTTLKSCYPSLYRTSSEVKDDLENNDSEFQDELSNSEMADTLKSISGPCDLPYFNKFRLSPDIAEALICCPSRITQSHQKRPLTTSTEASFSVQNKSTVAPTKTTKAPKIPDAVAALVYKPPPTCGYVNNSLLGTEEHENERRFPWIVALIGKQGHFCSGTLIDKYHVVTAAQCVHYLSSDDLGHLRVFLGDYKLNTVSDGPLIARRISRVIYHRHFSEQTLKNDVALLKLNLPAPIGTPKVLPICLPEVQQRHNNLEDINEDDTVVLAGWGRNWIHSPTPILRKATMKIWSNDDCRKKYGYLARSGGIADSMLCASSMSSQKAEELDAPFRKIGVDAGVTPISAPATAFNEEIHDCIGDGGSPLQKIMKDTNLYELVGITSWNIGCGRFPYVYTRLSKYLSWIDKNRRRY